MTVGLFIPAFSFPLLGKDILPTVLKNEKIRCFLNSDPISMIFHFLSFLLIFIFMLICVA